ncbi:hypothetical protein QTI66_30730 [Variovorax sp. J22R133]|uniref:hypothetical protein n=1 Tax=Variovorax brevis TaxID=3053503 RepID=UPI002576BEE6|nr:hypothetical protein [Variovorax sp. J22R133]MDM0116525.1 hypothetical protein [Variovorax sp. J22R133]
MNDLARSRAAIARALLCLLASAGVVPDAGAVFTSTGDYGSYGLVLQVGVATGVDTVLFDVANDKVGQGPVSGTSGQAGGVTVRVTPTRPFFGLEPQSVTLTVDSRVALSCQSGTCGGATIPFTSIRWTSNGGAPSGGNAEIVSGVFTGAAAQQLARFDPVVILAGSREMTNILNFEYINDTVYPAGNYTGSVRFTATMI